MALYKKLTQSFMKKTWNKIYTYNYNNVEWFFIKIILIVLWGILASLVLGSFQTIPMPQGICKIFPCELLLGGYPKYALIVIIILAAIFYILEIKQMITCLVIFILSTLLFTIEDSNGILNRNSIFTFVFFAQFLAYLLHHYDSKTDLKKNRIQFSVQVIAAGYTLSALSKLFNSGIFWVEDGKRITLQILKSYYSLYVNYGNTTILDKGIKMASFIENHTALVYFLLGISLILELFALVSIVSKKHALIYGLLLTAMHIGIYIVMDIAIVSIVIPMVLFMVNPLYIVWIVVKSLYLKLVFGSSKLFLSKTK